MCLGMRPRPVSLLLTSRRFQRHPNFVLLTFDVSRRNHSIAQSTIQTKSKYWADTERILATLTPEELRHAASRAEAHQPIENSAVRTLLRSVSRIGGHALGSDSRKFNMFSQLKSSIVYHGFPVIYMTLNPGEKFSPLALSYAGVPIDMSSFEPQLFELSRRSKILLQNPLAVVTYFHNTVRTILATIVKGGLFGEVKHHFGVIEYQGRGTPHIHMLVRPPVDGIAC